MQIYPIQLTLLEQLGEFPQHIEFDLKNIQTLKHSTDQNSMKKELMSIQLQENIHQAKKIRQRIPKLIKHKDKRDFLEVIVKNHILELQNIELELNLSIQEKTINDLKLIIDNKNSTIQHLQDLVPEESVYLLDDQDQNQDFQDLEIEMSKSVEEEEFNLRDGDYFDNIAFDQIYSKNSITQSQPSQEKQRESQELKSQKQHKKTFKDRKKTKLTKQEKILQNEKLEQEKKQEKLEKQKLAQKKKADQKIKIKKQKLPRLAQIYGIKKRRK